jgi:hypothetical protein
MFRNVELGFALGFSGSGWAPVVCYFEHGVLTSRETDLAASRGLCCMLLVTKAGRNQWTVREVCRAWKLRFITNRMNTYNVLQETSETALRWYSLFGLDVRRIQKCPLRGPEAYVPMFSAENPPARLYFPGAHGCQWLFRTRQTLQISK